MSIFNPDFKDFIIALNQRHVEYMLVGGYAVILRGYSSCYSPQAFDSFKKSGWQEQG